MTNNEIILIFGVAAAAALIYLSKDKIMSVSTSTSKSLTSADCQAHYGSPELKKAIVLFNVPAHLQIAKIPKSFYCNKDMVNPLTLAFQNLIQRGYASELKTWDGCFNIRKKRGGSTMSLHSWAVAIDLNAASNAFGSKPTLSTGFVKCFTDAGFDWGGKWSKPDGMHFQLKKSVVFA